MDNWIKDEGREKRWRMVARRWYDGVMVVMAGRQWFWLWSGSDVIPELIDVAMRLSAAYY